MNTLKKAVLVIDPLSAPQYIVTRFRECGFQVIALCTMATEDTYFSYDDLPFACILQSTQNIELDIKQLDSIEGYAIVHGFIGITACVPYAEKLLARLFSDKANDPTTSLWRFDKFMMNEVLKRNNLTHIVQKKLPAHLESNKKIQQTEAFFADNQREIVIKPSSGSAGSVGVLSPSSEKDIKHYYQRLHTGLLYDSDIVLQEKITGKEYYVDAVSLKGKIEIVSVGFYVKHEVNGLFIYQSIDTVDMFSQKIQPLLQYTISCLQALGMLNGFSHTEIIETKSGFKFIELNTRISGIHGWCNLLAERKYSRNQISVYRDLLDNKLMTPIKNRPVKQRIYMFKNKKGCYSKINLQSISNLSSYVMHKVLHSAMSTQQHNDESLLSLVMLILLESDNQTVIEDDTKILQCIEQQGSCLE